MKDIFVYCHPRHFIFIKNQKKKKKQLNIFGPNDIDPYKFLLDSDDE